MMQLFNDREVTLWMKNLVERKNDNSLFLSLTRLRKFQHFYVFWLQSILLFVHLYTDLPFFSRHIVSSINDKVIFPLDFRTLFELVISENFAGINMESHELGKRLLAKKSLGLKIHL